MNADADQNMKSEMLICVHRRLSAAKDAFPAGFWRVPSRLGFWVIGGFCFSHGF
jgi:hypothetical protein